MSLVYIDNAATTIDKPFGVRFASFKKLANIGRGGYKLAIDSAIKVDEVRGTLARFFHFNHPERVIFTKNCTEAINIALLGLLSPDDHVVISNIEHNSVIRPIHCTGIDYSLAIADIYGRVSVDKIAKQIKKNTKLICISHASNVLGTINSIATIGKFAHDNGILFMVDASQTAGVVDIDMARDNIDILALPGHKHLFGPFGTGALLIDEKIELKPFMLGGTGSNSDSFDMPEFLPDKYEAGTLNVAGIVGLGKGIEFINKIGIKNIAIHERKLTRYLLDELSSIPKCKTYGSKRSKGRVGIVSFNIEGYDSSTVGNILAEHNIAVRAGFHCSPLAHGAIGTSDLGTVRASVSWFNSFGDIDKLVGILRKM